MGPCEISPIHVGVPAGGVVMLVLCRWPYFRFMMIVLCSTCPGSLTMPSLFPSVPWALVLLLWWVCDSLLLWLTHVNFGCAYLLWWLDWEVPFTGLAFESLSPVGCSVQGGYEEPQPSWRREAIESEFWEPVASSHLSSLSSFCWLLLLNLWRVEGNFWESSGLAASVFTCWGFSPALGSLLIEQPATEDSVSKNTQKQKANNCISNSKRGNIFDTGIFIW